MLALSPAVGDRFLISAIEHPSVLAGGRFPAEAVETDSGHVPMAYRSDGVAERALAKGGRALVSLMLANNETGVIQPVSEAARLVHEAGGSAACRRRPGGWANSLRYQCAWGGSSDDFRPQDRRLPRVSARSSGVLRPCTLDPLDQRRRPGARRPRRHRECRRYRRLRCGCAAAHDRVRAGLRKARRAGYGSRCAPARIRPQGASPRTSSSSAPTVRGCPIPRCSRSRASRRRPPSSPSIWRGWRCPRAPPAPRARCSPRMCWPRWGFQLDLARGAVRVSLGPTTTESEIESLPGSLE